jgi:hypothetical protein
MNTKKMTHQEEYEFYADPDNQTPQGPARRRQARLTELVPVRFPAETLERMRHLADADDRSVSSWIRRAVDHELQTADQTPQRRRTARQNATSNAKRTRT